MTLLLAGLLLGLAFGMAARLGRFCLLRGLRGVLVARQAPGGPDDDQGQALRAFALALAVALLATQALALAGQIVLSEAQVVRPRFAWPAMLLGGVLFGVGMVLARSCGARALVLLGGGNLRALAVLLCLALAAQATLTGVLAPLRQALQGFGVVTLDHTRLAPALAAWGLPPAVAWGLAVVLPALALLVWALRKPVLRAAPAQAWSAAAIGLVVAAGWWVTAQVAVDPFEPRPLTSLSFIGPLAEALLYLQLAVGREAGVGALIVAGTVLGAALMAGLTRSQRLEGFAGRPGQLLQALAGGLLMGFGGVLAVGCSVGQGLSGLSTGALASLPACAGIVAGALAALMWQQRGSRPRTAPSLSSPLSSPPSSSPTGDT